MFLAVPGPSEAAEGTAGRCPMSHQLAVRLVVAVLLVVAALAGCGREADKSAAVLLSLLQDRRAACEEQGAMVSSAWSEATGSRSVSNEAAIAQALASESGVALAAQIRSRGEQARPHLQDLAGADPSERRQALVDFAAEIDALCSFTGRPVGFSLLTFNQQRSEKRVQLEGLASRAALLVPAVDVAGELAELDAQVAAARQAAIAKRHAELEQAVQEAQEQLRREAEEATRREAEKAAARRAAQQEQAELDAIEAAQQEELRKVEEQARKRLEAARLAEFRDGCRSSQAWRRQWGPTFRSVAGAVGRVPCDQLVAEADALERTNPPAAVSKLAGDLAGTLREASRACTANLRTVIESTRARAQSLGRDLDQLEQRCAAEGL